MESPIIKGIWRIVGMQVICNNKLSKIIECEPMMIGVIPTRKERGNIIIGMLKIYLNVNNPFRHSYYQHHDKKEIGLGTYFLTDLEKDFDEIYKYEYIDNKTIRVFCLSQSGWIPKNICYIIKKS